MELRYGMNVLLPFVAMVSVETGEVALTTLTKAAMNSGMSNFVYIVYYNSLGALILLPYLIFRTIRHKPPPLTFALLCRFFLLGLLGKSLLMFGFIGLDYSSPALTAALGNLSPVYTFLLAIIFRMEKIDFRKQSTIAKSLGTVIAVTGALIVTLYRGPRLMPEKSAHLLHQQQYLLPHGPLHSNSNSHSHWILGALLLAIGYIFGSCWNIAQAATVKEYPEQSTVTFFYVLFGTIQCAVVSFIVERNPSAWRLQPGVQMAATVCSAIFGTAIRYTVLTWCLNEKGPLYVALFKPLGMVISVIGGVLFLGDVLYLGSIIGAIVIAVGFYTVTWGQAKERDTIVEDFSGLESSDENTPLLQNQGTKKA